MQGRRLIVMFAAALVAAGSPLATDLAVARDKPGRHEARDDRGGGRGWGDVERRGWSDRRGYDARRFDGFRHRRVAPGVGGPRGLRPGRFLPPDSRGARIGDYGRYRLRPPPQGYGWYRVGDDIALVSLADGQIFDIIID